MTDVVKCEARVSRCVCSLEAGHEGPHLCTADGCNGMWKGEGDSFESIRLPDDPSGIGAIFNALLGAPETP